MFAGILLCCCKDAAGQAVLATMQGVSLICVLLRVLCSGQCHAKRYSTADCTRRPYACCGSTAGERLMCIGLGACLTINIQFLLHECQFDAHEAFYTCRQSQKRNIRRRYWKLYCRVLQRRKWPRLLAKASHLSAQTYRCFPHHWR